MYIMDVTCNNYILNYNFKMQATLKLSHVISVKTIRIIKISNDMNYIQLNVDDKLVCMYIY